MNANETPYTIPPLLGQALCAFPEFPRSVAFCVGLNALLREHIPEDVGEILAGRSFRFAVTDAKLTFDMTWKNGRFVARHFRDNPDLTIRANVYDFLLLAQRKEDPDSLFFSRRLVTEGDTELGLVLKNTLDGIGLSLFELAKALPQKFLADLKTHFSKRGES